MASISELGSRLFFQQTNHQPKTPDLSQIPNRIDIGYEGCCKTTFHIPKSDFQQLPVLSSVFPHKIDTSTPDQISKLLLKISRKFQEIDQAKYPYVIYTDQFDPDTGIYSAHPLPLEESSLWFSHAALTSAITTEQQSNGDARLHTVQVVASPQLFKMNKSQI